MTINDLQLKIDVLQKTLEKKRQPNKFIDPIAATPFNSLTLTPSVTTPTQLNSPMDANFPINPNSDFYSNDSLFSLPSISTTANASCKSNLNGTNPNSVLTEKNQIDQTNNITNNHSLRVLASRRGNIEK